ncbi:response regulator transcription factor [Lentzea jiangxiensis]|uniref:DNA-binding response regulator, NarL/FixJ family, contains REC and HTH domains n=1 Tax=Lentzea jiangxiensis TaxID=641025 RepID=A0A1H0WUK6_9PSEU|nr:response regulator transcription factor [Lentzea jiangxiensis]SDP94289.1 DNA-binding response regulator, NarL/FixJ family, contains REC and HTH domains [Lentzea jiangxiensis]
MAVVALSSMEVVVAGVGSVLCQPVSVIVAHQHDIVRRGMEEVLLELDWVHHVRSFATCEAALAELHAGAPADVLLITGALFDLARESLARLDTRVVLLQPVAADLAPQDTRHVDGVLFEDTLSAALLVDALRQVSVGRVFMPWSAARALLEATDRETVSAVRLLLTPREMEALRFVTTGLSNKQIASRMGIGINGVKRLVSNVLAKTNCPTRIHAATYAVRSGLVDSA